MTVPTFDVYRRLNRVQKGSWTRIARRFSIAHADRVWSAKLAESKTRRRQRNASGDTGPPS